MSGPTYLLVDRGEGLREPERSRDDEITVVTKLFELFREEVDKAAEAGEDAVRKAQKAARTVRRKGSVQNLKAVAASSVPPPNLPPVNPPKTKK